MHLCALLEYPVEIHCEHLLGAERVVLSIQLGAGLRVDVCAECVERMEVALRQYRAWRESL